MIYIVVGIIVYSFIGAMFTVYCGMRFDIDTSTLFVFSALYYLWPICSIVVLIYNIVKRIKIKQNKDG